MPRPRVDEVPGRVDADHGHRVARNGAVDGEHADSLGIAKWRLVVRIDASVVRVEERERLFVGGVLAGPLAKVAAGVAYSFSLCLGRELGHRLDGGQVEGGHVVKLPGRSLLLQL